MKNRKGFTLVELLAVVVVLVIVALISVPIILNVIDNVRKGAIKNSAYGMIESANVYYAKNINKINDPIEFEINNGVQVGTEKLSYSGKVNMGYLMLFKNGKVAVCVDDGKYSASKGVDEKKVTVIEGICTGEYDEATKSYLVSQTSSGFTSISVKSYTSESQLPSTGNSNDIAIISETKVSGYYVSGVVPTEVSEGLVWIVESPRSTYYLESRNVRIGVSYVMQYENNKWNLKHAYVFNNDEWKQLYYVDMTDSGINLENSNLGDIEIVKNYEYTGKYQEFEAPFSGYYNIELWGASGGTVSGVNAGKGAYTKGDIYLSVGDKIYIYVGGTASNTTGGWNGGGNGTTAISGSGAGGGGATDIRLTKTSSLTTWNEFNSLKSRIMVAAGGAGGSNFDGNTWWNNGGSGGTLEGNISTGGRDSVTWSGTAATQTAGGFTTTKLSGQNGGFGYAGNSYTGYSSAGGGSGYYGGSGGAHAGGLISGGSSYISGYRGCNSVSIDSKVDNIIHTGSAYHYSGNYFINTEMVDNSNTGNGKAKITILSIENKTKDQLEKEKDIFEYNYSYSGTSITKGNYQEFVAPKNGTYQFELWGASGGTVSNVNAGKGAYTKGEIYLEKGKKIYIYVGSSPINNTLNSTLGGYNGGGNGTTAVSGSGAGGGGATDIRLESEMKEWNEFESLKSRIMVAAGGAGGSNYDGNTWWNNGGAAGGLNGILGTGGKDSTSYTSTASTQTSGGLTHSTYPGTNGGFGYGGNGYTGFSSAGGGSGYYGGAGGAHAGGLVSGGSSYISGYDGCSSIKKESTSTNIIHNGNKYHYSGYYFVNAVMEPGVNSGNGKAKIVLKNETNNMGQMNPTIFNYYYSTTSENVGRYQEFIAQKDGYYKVELWGASGGTVSGVNAGRGAYTSGEIYLNKNTKLYVYVGGTVSSRNTLGGWNGGGNGTTARSGSGAGGGGATDIRTVVTSGLTIWNTSQSLNSRIMVAAGGAGGSNFDGNTWWNNGGAAGGLNGILGAGGRDSTSYTSTVSTQTSGGLTHSTYPGTNGGFGYGGNGYTGYSSAGAGSGWYGGGGGAHAGGILSGGSSYISGHAGCIAVTSSGNPKTNAYSTLSDSISYTGYKFINTEMIDGDGYNWTTERGSNGGAPTTNGLSTSLGNTGNGYAKVTYLGE